MTGARARPTPLCRSWLFVGGADGEALDAVPGCGADVAILELEDFTAPAERPAARARAAELFTAWRDAGMVAAVRVNPLDGDGRDDLAAVLPARPDIVMLPKVRGPGDILALDAEVARLEAAAGILAGVTELVPNIESAAALRQTFEIARANPRVAACLVASEDMAADLGAVRGADGRELAYVRERFLVDCVAAGVVAIDCPYTWTDLDGLRAEAEDARRLGYPAKSVVSPGHAAVVNAVMTPGEDAVAAARREIEAYEEARARGDGRAEVDGVLVETPTYLNARRLVARAEALARADGTDVSG